MALPRFVRRLILLGVFCIALLTFAMVLEFSLRDELPPQLDTETQSGQTVITLSDDHASFTRVVDVADTPDERRRGLQNRPVVEHGMLFIFDEEDERSFWMKDTLVPLDIAYFRADGTWVSSAQMEPCVADPCASYLSAGPAQFALEFPLGDIGTQIGSGWVLTLVP